MAKTKTVQLSDEIHEKLLRLKPVEAERVNVSRLSNEDFINRLLDDFAKRMKVQNG